MVRISGFSQIWLHRRQALESQTAAITGICIWISQAMLEINHLCLKSEKFKVYGYLKKIQGDA